MVELRAIDRELVAFTDQKQKFTGDLDPAVEHWAHRVAKPELTLRVAKFFSDQKTLVELCHQLVGEGGGSWVTGSRAGVDIRRGP